jgi:hypothetical protein
MLASDIGNLLHDSALQLDDMVDPTIAAALSEKDRRRLGVTPEEIAGALHTVAQGAKYLSTARAESQEDFVGTCCVQRGVASVGSGRSAGHMASESSLNAVASRSGGGTSVAIS